MRFLKKPCTTHRTKQVSRTSSPYWCDHVNTSTNSVEIFDVLADLWPKDEFASFYYIPIKSLCDNASPRNMNNSHISRTTARSSHAKPAWPICSLCWCGHVDMLCVVNFSVFMVLLPEGGMLRFYLEPARISIQSRAPYRPSALRVRAEGVLRTLQGASEAPQRTPGQRSRRRGRRRPKFAICIIKLV